MPSIRVRNSAYSTLRRDGPSTSEGQPYSLETIFSPDPPTTSIQPNSTINVRPQRSLPVMQRSQGQSGMSSQGRPRSGTTASRVHAHCTRNSIRPSFNPDADRHSVSTYNDSESRRASPIHLIPHNGGVTMQGSQADVVLRTEGDPADGLIGSALSLPQSHEDSPHIRILERDDLHHDDIVEHLDVIDPQVATVSNLTNAANSILIPPLSWYSRKPVLVLSSPPSSAHPDQEKGRFEDSLDRHVDDIFSRPSKIKRTMMGVWSFLKTPMGIITGIYGFLVVFWGAAIVIFLAKIINFHNANTQGFWVEVSSQVENGLFTVTGIGLIPSRVLDTYRIYKIWYYKRRTKKLRAKAGLPQLFDIDDLPDPAYDPNYVHVLTDEEQQDLHRQQVKFQSHQTWYRAHGTETHRAFPINMALLICCLNDGNSIFQAILCGTMWGLNRFQRPAWSTGILIPCSFLCGILAAIFIWRGGQQTKRIEQVEERLRAALAREHPINFDTGGDTVEIVDSEPSGPSTIDGEKQLTEAETAVDEHMTVPATESKVKFSN